MADSSPASSPASSPKGTIRKRVTSRSTTNNRAAAPGGGSSGLLRIYTDDAPGLRVDPVVVLVLSLCFIASVFGLHIIGKFLRK